MNELAVMLRDALGAGAVLAAPIALAGGVVTGLNPCCLPIYPAAAAVCCANRETCADQVRRLSLGAAVALALGLATATTMLGVLAAVGGRTMTTLSGNWVYGLAVIPLLAGAHMLGFVRFPPTLNTPSLPRASGIMSAFLAGLLLALVFGPCGTPLLAGLLSYAAFSGNPTYGGTLLFLYGIGIAIPVVVLGASAAKLAAGLEKNGRRIWVDRATGCLLVTMGLYLIWSA